MTVTSALGLLMSLSGCANHIEPVATKVIIKLPPPGLIVPCLKPDVISTNPAVTASEDVPRLKAALGDCAKQANEYLKWRAEHENTEGKNHE